MAERTMPQQLQDYFATCNPAELSDIILALIQAHTTNFVFNENKTEKVNDLGISVAETNADQKLSKKSANKIMKKQKKAKTGTNTKAATRPLNSFIAFRCEFDTFLSRSH